MQKIKVAFTVFILFLASATIMRSFLEYSQLTDGDYHQIQDEKIK